MTPAGVWFIVLMVLPGYHWEGIAKLADGFPTEVACMDRMQDDTMIPYIRGKLLILHGISLADAQADGIVLACVEQHSFPPLAEQAEDFSGIR